MRFEYVIDPELPVLAWCAVIRKNSDVVQVYAGQRVEVTENWFVEGAWDGPFQEGGFDQSYALMGSGGKISDGNVKFCTPCHYYEHIITHRAKDCLLVSNSLTFAYAMANDEPEPTYGCEQYDFADMRSRGLTKKFRSMPTRNGAVLCAHQFSNLIIDRNLNIRHEDKTRPPPPVDYASYYQSLREAMKGLLENAGDPSRKAGGYRPLCAISQGYDSVAVAAMARDFGCREALTYAKLDEDDRFPDDGGRAIANHLGMTFQEYSRVTFKRLPGLVHAEFSAHINGSYVQLKVAEEQLRGTIWLTGDSGGWVWAIHSYEHISNMRRINSDPAMLVGVSAGEFRLRVGYIQASIPMIGSANHLDIFRITRSKEMAPYLLGQSYDRPIPRRIAEEAGVPREMFGQRKMGGIHYNVLIEGLTGESREDFERYYAELGVRIPWHREVLRSLQSLAYYLETRLFVMPINSALQAFDKRRVVIPLLPRRWRAKPTKLHYALNWGVDRIKNRYLTKLTRPVAEDAGRP